MRRQGCCPFRQAPQYPKAPHALGGNGHLSLLCGHGRRLLNSLRATLHLLRALPRLVQEALHVTGPAYEAAAPGPDGAVLGRVPGEVRAEGLRGCEPHSPCAYEVRCRLSSVCSAAQTVRDGGRPLPVAGQGAGLGRQVVLDKAGSAVPLVPPRKAHVLVRGLCGSPRDAGACAAGAEGWGPRWTVQNRPGRSGL